MKPFTITKKDFIKMYRKHLRDTTHRVKPTRTTDKKKEANKKHCRNFNFI